MNEDDEQSASLDDGCSKAHGTKKTLHGTLYQMKLFLLFLKNALANKYKFKLYSEVEKAEKFDDVIFRYDDGQYRFLQAKHKLNPEKEKISLGDLLSENPKNPFSLQKYFTSFLSLHQKYKDRVKDIIICTNVDFHDDFKQNNLIQETGVDDLLQVGVGGGERFKFHLDKNKKIVEHLKKPSILNSLANKLAEIAFENGSLTLYSPLFQLYHVSLAKEVLEPVNTAQKRMFKFKKDFMENIKLPHEVKHLREVFESKCFELCETFSWEDLEKKELPASEAFGVDKGKYPLRPLRDFIKDEEIALFFEKLSFASNQPSEEELGKLFKGQIFNDLENILNSEEDIRVGIIFDVIQIKMLDWLKDPKSVSLTELDNFFKEVEEKIKSVMCDLPNLKYKCVIEELAEAFHTDAPEFKLLNDEISEFKKNSKRRFLNIISSDKSMFVCQAKLYKIEPTFVWYINELILYNRSNKVIKAIAVNNLVIISCADEKSFPSSELKGLYDKLITFILKNSEVKIVLLSQQSSLFASYFTKNESIIYSCLKLKLTKINEFNLGTSLTEKLLRRNIVFQGDVRTLEDLIGAGDGLEEIMDPDSLCELFTENNIIVGIERPSFTDENSPFYDPYHIDIVRKLNLQVMGKKQLRACLEGNKEDVFLFDNLDSERIQILAPKNEKDGVRSFPKAGDDENFFKGRFFAIHIEDPESDFKELRASEEIAEKNIHWFSATRGKAFILKKSTKLSTLRDYAKISSEVEAASLGDSERKFIIIVGDPGMGKSTVLTTLSEKLDRRFWVVRVDLKSSEPHIEETLDTDFIDLEDILKFFSNIGVFKSTFSFEKSFFNYYFNSRRQIVLLLDGFDEIKYVNKDKVIELIKYFNRNGIKVLLTTRTNAQEELENSLGCFSYLLKPFGPKEQEEFLKGFWTIAFNFNADPIEIGNFAKEILWRFRGLEVIGKKDLVGAALQAKMVAEIFREKCGEYLRDRSFNIYGLSIRNILNLFDRFVECQYYRYFEKENIGNIKQLTGTYQVITKKYTEAHEYLALKMLFPDDEASKEILKGQPCEEITKIELRNIGLLKVLGDDYAGRFVHQTYAEYFVAKLLLYLLQQSEDQPKFKLGRKFMLENIFFDKNRLIQVFLTLGFVEKRSRELDRKWEKIMNCQLLKENEAKTMLFTKFDFVSLGELPDNLSCKSLKELQRDSGDCMYPNSLSQGFSKKYFEEENIDQLETTLRFLSKQREFQKYWNITAFVLYYITRAYLANRILDQTIDTVLKCFEFTDRIRDYFPILRKIDSFRDNERQLLEYLKEIFLNVDIPNLQDLNEILRFVLHAFNGNMVEYINNNKCVQTQYQELLINFYETCKFDVVDVQSVDNSHSSVLQKFSTDIIYHPNIIEETRTFISSLFEKNDVYFLDIKGIFISKFLMILTPVMSTHFTDYFVTDEYVSSTGWTFTPFLYLIHYFLKTMEEKDLPHVDKVAFLGMIVAFIDVFASTTRSKVPENKIKLRKIPFSKEKVTTILKLMEYVLTLEPQPVQEMKLTIKLLFAFRELGLKLIDIDDPKILIISPSCGFRFKFSSDHHKSKIIELLLWLHENTSADDKEIEKKCREILKDEKKILKRSMSDPSSAGPSKRQAKST